MSGVCDGPADVYSEREVRARCEHRCAACRETIPVGHRYWRIFIAAVRESWSYKRCLRCQAIHVHLRELCDDYGFWPSETLDCGEEYTAHWGEEPPPEIAALAFVTADEMQARAGAA